MRSHWSNTGQWSSSDVISHVTRHAEPRPLPASALLTADIVDRLDHYIDRIYHQPIEPVICRSRHRDYPHPSYAAAAAIAHGLVVADGGSTKIENVNPLIKINGDNRSILDVYSSLVGRVVTSSRDLVRL